MNRRRFVAGIGSVAAWPVAAWAQADRIRQVAVLMTNSAADDEARINLETFREELAKFGWTDGGNIRMHVRWAEADIGRMEMFARELVQLQPDVIVSHTTPVTAAFQRQTKTIPIVFVIVSDPVGSGFVPSLARPGANITGFVNIEASMGGKWLELLVQIAPDVRRAAIMYNPDTAPGRGEYFRPSFEAGAQSLMVQPILLLVHNEPEIERGLASLAGDRQSGLVVMTDSFNIVHRSFITARASQYRIPAVYAESVYVRLGGLLSYGEDAKDIFGRAAPYVDRILRGAKPQELPVQLPVKMDMAVNLRTAKLLGLTVPQSILLRADEIIE